MADTEDMAVQSEEQGSSEQESPTVEQNQLEVEVSGEAETEGDVSAKPQDRNWKALRQENEKLKAELENAQKVPDEPRVPVSQRPDLNLLMSPDDKLELRMREFRAEQEFSDSLEGDPILRRAVEGEYIDALSKYNAQLVSGGNGVLPDPYKITKHIKQQFDAKYGAVSKQAEVTGAKKATEAKASKEATVEAEGRSDRSRKALSADEFSNLTLRSRRGDSDAIAERLSRSGL